MPIEAIMGYHHTLDWAASAKTTPTCSEIGCECGDNCIGRIGGRCECNHCSDSVCYCRTCERRGNMHRKLPPLVEPPAPKPSPPKEPPKPSLPEDIGSLAVSLGYAPNLAKFSVKN